jgi:hypothetical protein
MDSLAYLIHLSYYLIVPIYIRSFSYSTYMLYIAFQHNLNHVQILWGSRSNVGRNLCLHAYFFLWTLAWFVIVNQKGEDCKGILPLTFILINDDTWASDNLMCLARFIYRF